MLRVSPRFLLCVAQILFPILLHSAGTKDDWLALIADRSNWIEPGSQPSGNLYNAAPEPSRALLVLLGGGFPRWRDGGGNVNN